MERKSLALVQNKYIEMCVPASFDNVGQSSEDCFGMACHAEAESIIETGDFGRFDDREWTLARPECFQLELKYDLGS